MKIVFEYSKTTHEGSTFSATIQANENPFDDEDVQKGCYEIIKNAALYIDVPTCTAILNLLNAIDISRQE